MHLYLSFGHESSTLTLTSLGGEVCYNARSGEIPNNNDDDKTST